MEPLILATGILLGGAMSSGHVHTTTTVRHTHIHDRYCPTSHHVSYRYRPYRSRYYRSRLRPVRYRTTPRYHRSHYKRKLVRPNVTTTIKSSPRYRYSKLRKM